MRRNGVDNDVAFCISEALRAQRYDHEFLFKKPSRIKLSSPGTPKMNDGGVCSEYIRRLV